MSNTPKVVWRSGSALLSWSAGMGSIPGEIKFSDRPTLFLADEATSNQKSSYRGRSVGVEQLDWHTDAVIVGVE